MDPSMWCISQAQYLSFSCSNPSTPLIRQKDLLPPSRIKERSKYQNSMAFRATGELYLVCTCLLTIVFKEWSGQSVKASEYRRMVSISDVYRQRSARQQHPRLKLDFSTFTSQRLHKVAGTKGHISEKKSRKVISVHFRSWVDQGEIWVSESLEGVARPNKEEMRRHIGSCRQFRAVSLDVHVLSTSSSCVDANSTNSEI